MGSEYVLAADIGGTKVSTAVISSAGEIMQKSKAPTDKSGPPALIGKIVAMLQDDLARSEVSTADVVGLGVGIPAAIDAARKTIIWAPNLPGWEDVPLHDELSTRLHLPVCIEYDGHAAVMGEWWLGAGRGYQNVVFVIVGTGIGGGMILDGRLYRGASRLAGTAGWFTLSTQRVSDGHAHRVGHWESLAAGPGIVRLAEEKLRENDEPSLLRRQEADLHDELTTRRIFAAARQGDPLAGEVVRHVGEVLGIGIANIVSLLNPEVVILGGGVGIQSDLLLAPIREVVRDIAQPMSARAAQVVIAQLAEDAGLLGAARGMLLCRESRDVQ